MLGALLQQVSCSPSRARFFEACLCPEHAAEWAAAASSWQQVRLHVQLG